MKTVGETETFSACHFGYSRFQQVITALFPRSSRVQLLVWVVVFIFGLFDSIGENDLVRLCYQHIFKGQSPINISSLKMCKYLSVEPCIET